MRTLFKAKFGDLVSDGKALFKAKFGNNACEDFGDDSIKLPFSREPHLRPSSSRAVSLM